MSPGPVLRAEPDPDAWSFIYGRWRGRVSRRGFWIYGIAIPVGLTLLVQALLDIAGVDPVHAEWTINLMLLYPALAVSAKRWQDRDRSAWWVLVMLVPLIGWLWALVDNGFVKGTTGPNRFGPAPRR